MTVLVSIGVLSKRESDNGIYVTEFTGPCFMGAVEDLSNLNGEKTCYIILLLSCCYQL